MIGTKVTFSNNKPTTDKPLLYSDQFKDSGNLYNKALQFLQGLQINAVWTKNEKIPALFPHLKEGFQMTRKRIQEEVKAMQSEIVKVTQEADVVLEKCKDHFPAEEAEHRSADRRWVEDRVETRQVFEEGRCIQLLELQPGPVAGVPGPARLYHPGNRPESLSSDFEISEDSFF